VVFPDLQLRCLVRTVGRNHILSELRAANLQRTRPFLSVPCLLDNTGQPSRDAKYQASSRVADEFGAIAAKGMAATANEIAVVHHGILATAPFAAAEIIAEQVARAHTESLFRTRLRPRSSWRPGIRDTGFQVGSLEKASHPKRVRRIPADLFFVLFLDFLSKCKTTAKGKLNFFPTCHPRASQRQGSKQMLSTRTSFSAFVAPSLMRQVRFSTCPRFLRFRRAAPEVPGRNLRACEP
jgi:hypothetical protein